MRILAVAVGLGLVLLAGCRKSGPATSGGTPADSAAAPAAAPGAAAAQLDSGNTAYRAKDYAGALAHYRAATEGEPRSAAGWFGVYMAQSALGNKPAADSALTQAQRLDPGMAGAHQTGGSADTGLPPGHPRMGPSGMPPGHPSPSPR